MEASPKSAIIRSKSFPSNKLKRKGITDVDKDIGRPLAPQIEIVGNHQSQSKRIKSGIKNNKKIKKHLYIDTILHIHLYACI